MRDAQTLTVDKRAALFEHCDIFIDTDDDAWTFVGANPKARAVVDALIDAPINWHIGQPLHEWWRGAPMDWVAADLNFHGLEQDGFLDRLPKIGNADTTGVHALYAPARRRCSICWSPRYLARRQDGMADHQSTRREQRDRLRGGHAKPSRGAGPKSTAPRIRTGQHDRRSSIRAASWSTRRSRCPACPVVRRSCRPYRWSRSKMVL